jgi:hypothetical protein
LAGAMIHPTPSLSKCPDTLILKALPARVKPHPSNFLIANHAAGAEESRKFQWR